MKRKQLIPAAVGVLALAASQASAQMVYEPFDYGSNSIGTALDNLTGKPTYSGYTNPMNGQQYFAANTGYDATTDTDNGGTDIQIVGGNLTMPSGLSPAIGNSAQYNIPEGDAISRTARIGLNPSGITSGTLYYSLSFKVTDGSHLGLNNGAPLKAGGFFAAFNDDVGTLKGNTGTTAPRLQLRTPPDWVAGDPITYQVGVKSNVNGNLEGITYAFDPTKFTPGPSGDMVFVVAAYTFGPADGDDTMKLWVNPNASTFGAATAPDTTLVVGAGTDLAELSSFVWRQGNQFEPQGIQVDELRVDTSWAQVTAPAGTSWAGGAGDWSTGWSGTTPDAAGTFVTFGAGAAGAVNVDSPRTVGTLNFKNSTGYTISGNAITLNGGAGGTSAVNVYAVIDPTTGDPQAGTQTIAAPLTMANDTEFNVGVNQTLNVSGVIGGSAALTKNGGGVMVLSGANSYTGGTQISDGIVGITSDASLGAAPASPATNVTLSAATLRFDAPVSLNPNRSIQLNGSGIIDTNGNNITLDPLLQGGTLVKAGDGTLELTNAGNVQSGNRVNKGTLRIGSDAVLGDPAGTVTLNSGTLQFASSFNPSTTHTIAVTGFGGAIDTNGNNVIFGGAVTGAGTLIKTGDGQLTLGGSNQQGGTRVHAGVLDIFNDANLGAASGTLTLDGGTLRTETDYDSGRTVAIDTNGGTFDTNTHNVSVGTVEGTGAFTKAGTGALTVAHVRAGDLSVTGGRLAITSTGGQPVGVSVVGAVSTSADSLIDLTDNKLISTTAAQTGTWDAGASHYTGISGLVQSARGTGNWSGTTGITSSTAASNANPKLFSIGVVKAGDIKSIADDATATFAGQTVHGSDTIAMYTYGGDANLDGKINIDDYGLIDSHVGQSGTAFGWHNGDFNYDGKINIDDYGIIDGNIGAQGAPIPTIAGASAGVVLDGVSAVPEPASLGLLAIAGAGLLNRRRCRTR